MADGGIKGAVLEAAKITNEAVVKPVTDEIGQAIEQGAQAIVNRPLNPQQVQQKQMQDQNGIAEAQRKLSYWKQIAQSQAQVRQAEKQEDMEKNQEKKQEAQIKQYEIVQKKQDSKQIEEVARSQGEKRAGRGVGG